MKIFLILLFLLFEVFANSLSYEDSPYLLQHAKNPVNWYAWNKQTLTKAKNEHKLIFLSIGYSTCHWCHKMEEESYSQKDVAKVLNKNYIAIKVDREEMPALDRYYQKLYFLMHKQSGGWPLHIILTPELKPFFSTTYIPKKATSYQKGIITILNDIASLYKNNPQKIELYAQSLQRLLNNPPKMFSLSWNKNKHKDIYAHFLKILEKNFDTTNYGIGFAPKFPHANLINNLLDLSLIQKDKKAKQYALLMLDAMAKGGIYDQIEGGFFRYSTDESWSLVHFEKMLYTNAELLKAYSKAYFITHNETYKKIAQEIVHFVDAKLKQDSLFMSGSDADSLNPNTNKKEEGFYFTLKYQDALNILKKNNIKNPIKILEYLDITKIGNFHTRNQPRIDDFTQPPHNLIKAKKILTQLRKRNPYPFVDYKVLTSWNALYIDALLYFSSIDPAMKQSALFYLNKLYMNLYKNGTLYHQKVKNKPLKVKASLEDYAFLIDALLQGYKISFEKKYLTYATQLTKQALQLFYKNNTWYEATYPFKVQATLEDGAYANMVSVMLENLLELSFLTENQNYFSIVQTTLQQNYTQVYNYTLYSSGAITLMQKLNKEILVLKSTPNNLYKLQNALKTPQPYYYFKAIKEQIYLGCKNSSCLIYAKNLKQFLQKLKNLEKSQ